MTKKDIFKTACSFVSSIAVGSLTTMIIKSNAIPTNLKEKFAVGLGGFVIGSMISDKASDYVSDEIDRVFDILEEAKNAVKQENVIIEEK